MEYVAKEWVTKLYNCTKEVWEQNGKGPKGFAIFYSPIKINPTITFIGINPGGDGKDFNEQNCTIPPIKNEYLTAKYLMAQRIRQILKVGDLMWVLEDEDYVKFNLYFF